MVPGEFFPHYLKDFPVVRRFQVIQNSPQAVELKVVCGGPWRPGDRESITNEIESLLGEQVEFQLSEVNEIPLTSAGKLRVVVSNCGG
jgi:phenylacetate-CoA ligase